MANLSDYYELKKLMVNIYGVSGIGKTGTLLKLTDIIKSDPSFSLIDTLKINDRDISLFCEYKGRRVGVMTAGDPVCHHEVSSFLADCLKHDCDVIFAASRTRGYIYDIELDFANNNGYMFIKTSPLCVCNASMPSYKPLHALFAKMLEHLI